MGASKMKDINTFVIIGRLTRDPEIRMTTTGMQVVSFTLAVSGGKREQEEITHFLLVTVFGRLAELVGKYCYKGNRVAVRGHIVLNSYLSKEGTKVSKIALEVEEVQFLERISKPGEKIPDITQEENDGMYYDFEDLPF